MIITENIQRKQLVRDRRSFNLPPISHRKIAKRNSNRKQLPYTKIECIPLTSLRGANSACPPSDGKHEYFPFTSGVKKHSPRPVPAPIHAIGAAGFLGASCNVTHSVASLSVRSPYPMAKKSLTMRTVWIFNSRSKSAPLISHDPRLVKNAALSLTGPATAKHAVTGLLGL